MSRLGRPKAPGTRPAPLSPLLAHKMGSLGTFMQGLLASFAVTLRGERGQGCHPEVPQVCGWVAEVPPAEVQWSSEMHRFFLLVQLSPTTLKTIGILSIRLSVSQRVGVP